MDLSRQPGALRQGAHARNPLVADAETVETAIETCAPVQHGLTATMHPGTATGCNALLHIA